ncbi:PQQ-dependent sugar dehydrogenase [Mesobacillus foraminis]|uniref:Glucose/arabinose dehydrogenase n=1 Tax=Mesobacillus foraminis TaxID=279826 RepID=A0A4R2BBY1_9BACI|nr:sorbosone dehydrogenase family protein [Mesobacillus foraminis]TCN23993.1 glucose/arabinose dehydrogenase [Mesobacillus foraminis]
MKTRLPVILLASMLLIGCSNSGPEGTEESQPGQVQLDEGGSEEQETAAQPVEAESLAENLKIPWSINKINDLFYISERLGSIIRMEDGQQTRQEVSLEKPLADAAEAGLLGFVLVPGETDRAFAYYTYQDNGQFNRIVELKLTGDVWKETRLILDKIPSGNVHHGGRLRIGPDGKLYATAGDAAVPENAQNLNSLGGKILRLNLDGSVPADNPFRDSYVYSYGHRNPQGLAWDEDGTMYASEHGPSAHDEINVIEPGKNYGWPEITGDEKKEGMVTPLFQSGEDTWAPSGIAVHEGKLYVATLRGNAVREFDPATKETRAAVTGFGRIRDVWIEGHDLYFVSNNTDGRGNPAGDDDKLYRIKLK